MWLRLKVQLVGVHHQTKDMPDIAKGGGSAGCIFSFSAPRLAKMGNLEERSKGQDVNKVWTPEWRTIIQPASFPPIFFFQIFTISVKRTPLIKFLSSIPRDNDYMVIVKYVELRSLTMEKQDRVAPRSAQSSLCIEKFQPTYEGTTGRFC